MPFPNIENKLLSFDSSVVNSETINEFKKIIDSLSVNDKKELGEKFEVWKLGCLYHFLISLNQTDLTFKAPEIIQKFKEIESKIIHKNGEITVNQNMLKILYAATRFPEYLEILNNY